MGESASTFTTWRDLVNQLKSDLAGRAFRTMQSYSVAGRTVSYRSLAELLNLLDRAEKEAEEEEGLVYAGRTYEAVVNNGRQVQAATGSWSASSFRLKAAGER